jgi:glucose-1-phosphate adenylyltransferase
MEVSLEEARSFGVMGIDNNNQILHFEEKPANPECIPGKPNKALASMGIYVFSMDLLMDVLKSDNAKETSSHDFGKDIIPQLIKQHPVYAYPFGGINGRVEQDQYWRDVGTLDAYYEANMDLLQSVPPLNLYQENWPIWTHQAQYPPARTVPGSSGNEGIFINSIVAGGTVIAGGSVQHSILFPSVFVGDESIVEDSIVFEGVTVGDGAKVIRSIVDKNVQIPPGEMIGVDLDRDSQRFRVSDKGIVVVPKNYTF